METDNVGSCLIFNAYAGSKKYGCTHHTDLHARRLTDEIEATRQEDLDASIKKQLRATLEYIASEGIDVGKDTVRFALHSGVTKNVGKADLKESVEAAFAQTGDNVTLVKYQTLGEPIRTRLDVATGNLIVNTNSEERLLSSIEL